MFSFSSLGLQRRSMIQSLSAGLALAALPGASVYAAAPKVGAQQLGIHRMKLGEFEVTTLLDGFLEVPTGVLQGDAAHIREHLTGAGQKMDVPIRLPVNTFLVNTGFGIYAST